MMVYCVFQRLQLNMYQCEWLLQKVFSTQEAAEKYCEEKIDREDWVWEGHWVR